jgi:hypothetical protein
VVHPTECEHEALTVRRPEPARVCHDVIVEQLSGMLFIDMSLTYLIVMPHSNEIIWFLIFMPLATAEIKPR